MRTSIPKTITLKADGRSFHFVEAVGFRATYGVQDYQYAKTDVVAFEVKFDKDFSLKSARAIYEEDYEPRKCGVT